MKVNKSHLNAYQWRSLRQAIDAMYSVHHARWLFNARVDPRAAEGVGGGAAPRGPSPNGTRRVRDAIRQVSKSPMAVCQHAAQRFCARREGANASGTSSRALTELALFLRVSQ